MSHRQAVHENGFGAEGKAGSQHSCTIHQHQGVMLPGPPKATQLTSQHQTGAMYALCQDVRVLQKLALCTRGFSL